MTVSRECETVVNKYVSTVTGFLGFKVAPCELMSFALKPFFKETVIILVVETVDNVCQM